MTSNSLSVNEKNFLKDLSIELNNQNNRFTSYPVWRILKIKKYLGFKDRYADGVCIYNKDTDEVYDNESTLINCILNNAEDINGNKYLSINDFLVDRGYDIAYINEKLLVNIIDTELKLDNLTVEWYKEVHELEGCFLTEKGINEYLELNKHKMKEDVHIYVESMWDNKEYVRLIDILKKI